MNILMFNYEYPPVGGGGGVVHEVVCEELARRHRVCVITSAFADLPRREVRNGVEIVRVPVLNRRDPSAASLESLLSYPPAAWLAARRLLRERSFHVVNSYFAVPTAPAGLPVARRAGIPHVLSIQGGDIYDPSKRLAPHRLWGVRQVVGAMLRHSDAVVAASTNIRDHAYRFYDFDGEIEMIPLGIRKPEVPPASREELDLPRGAFLAVTVGRLVRRKNIDELLRALTSPECAGVHLVVVGAGPELERLRGAATDLALNDRVRFAGRVSETRKWQILRCADVYVSATMHEGYGLVYLEAMAAGLPVVTPDDGGHVDFLRDGETGYMVPAGGRAALAAAIARVAADRTAAARMGQNNLARSPAHRIEICADAYEALFARLVATRRDTAVAERSGRLAPQ
ncbi:MAG TPA: glycosyltransferase family 4 protein [Gemmatimonadaceae bacterium]|nr:glycosyltransferase family 4 protein [Gemmatimonadaceae bacterium]